MLLILLCDIEWFIVCVCIELVFGLNWMMIWLIFVLDVVVGVVVVVFVVMVGGRNCMLVVSMVVRFSVNEEMCCFIIFYFSGVLLVDYYLVLVSLGGVFGYWR